MIAWICFKTLNLQSDKKETGSFIEVGKQGVEVHPITHKLFSQ